MQLSVFKYDQMDNDPEVIFSELTVITIENRPWFIAADICYILGLTNVTESLKNLDDDEKLTSVILRAGQNRAVNLVNESGLCALIFRSKKPFAKKFRKWVTNEVLPSIREKGSYTIKRNAELSNFVIRYNENFDRIDNGYFSVIGELFIRIYGKFHVLDYDIPDKSVEGTEIRPDTSVGKLFPKYLEKYYPEYKDKFKLYSHKFHNGMIKRCRQYENVVLPIFIEYVDNIWIPFHSHEYFKSRDRKALEYLPKLIEGIKPIDILNAKNRDILIEYNKKRNPNESSDLIEFKENLDDLLKQSKKKKG
ncbi:MAG: hypothetical protein LBV43_10045 [Prevotella sp.]|jgi:hypothetical protein|nr:hypothetical protein [Prevotella sp.]